MLEPEVESRPWDEQLVLDAACYRTQVAWLFERSVFYREKLSAAGISDTARSYRIRSQPLTAGAEPPMRECVSRIECPEEMWGCDVVTAGRDGSCAPREVPLTRPFCRAPHLPPDSLAEPAVGVVGVGLVCYHPIA